MLPPVMVVPGGSDAEKERTATRSSGGDSQARYSALCWPVRNGGSQGSWRLPSDASRHIGRAQTLFRRHVSEGLSPSGRLTGSVDAIAGSLRPENGGTR